MSGWIKLHRNLLLTSGEDFSYTESLKRKTRLSPPSDLVIFLYLPKWRMIAGNILNTGRACLFYGFSESATSQICVAFLKKVKQMTNTTIQNLLNILETELGSIYRSARVKPATNNSMDSYFALSEKQKNRIKQLCHRHLVLQSHLSKITEE